MSIGEHPCHLSGLDLSYQEPCSYSSSCMHLPSPYFKTNCYPCSINMVAFSPFAWQSSRCKDRSVPWGSQHSPEVPAFYCQEICLWPIIVKVALSAEAPICCVMLNCVMSLFDVTFTAFAHKSIHDVAAGHRRLHLPMLSLMTPLNEAIVDAATDISTTQQSYSCH